MELAEVQSIQTYLKIKNTLEKTLHVTIRHVSFSHVVLMSGMYTLLPTITTHMKLALSAPV